MAFSPRTIRILSASALSVVLVAGAYAASGPVPFLHSKIADAESTDELLKKYAAKDTDADGLPDWEEALYGTNPNDAHSVNATLTDSAAVNKGMVQPRFTSETTASSTNDVPVPDAAPDSLTDSFARALLENYVRSRNGQPATSADIATFAQDAIKDLLAHQGPSVTYPATDLRVSGNGSAALIAYAASAQVIFDTNELNTPKGQDDYISDIFLNEGDTTAAKQLKALSAAYIKTAKALIALPAPAEAATAHLEIANAMLHIGTALSELSTANTDPLQSMLGLSLYKQASAEYVKGFSDLAATFTAQQVQIQDGTAGSDLYQTALKARTSTKTP